MGRQPRFVKGEPFNNMAELQAWLLSDGWVYYRHKPLAPGWVTGMVYRTLSEAILNGWLFRAMPREEVAA